MAISHDTHIMGPKLKVHQNSTHQNLLPWKPAATNSQPLDSLGMNLILDKPSQPRDGIDIHSKLVPTQGFQHVIKVGFLHE
jgi:hypothetical protein